MSEMTLRLLFLGANILVLVLILLIYRRVKQTQPQRRVEAPNSKFESRYVADLNSKESWEKLDLARMHRVNREEVERVLRKLHATSMRALTPSERAFLDRMVEAERRSATSG